MRYFDFKRASDVILRSILADAVIKGCGMESNTAINNIARNILEDLDITVERVREQVGMEAVAESNVAIKSLVNAVDEATATVSRLMSTSEKYRNISEDELDGAYIGAYCESEDKNIMAETVVAILDNVVTSLQTDIKTASKLVLQSIKEDQEIKKEMEKDELENFDNADGGEKDNLSDPLEDEPVKDDEEEKKDDSKEDEPAEPKEESKEDKSEEKEEPKEEGKSNVEDEENPFESMKGGKIDIQLYGWNGKEFSRPFAGLEAGDIVKFSTFCANKHLGGDLVSAYDNMVGMEDEEFKNKVSQFQTVGRTYAEVAVGSLLLLGKLGLQGNNNAIKYPHLYVEE